MRNTVFISEFKIPGVLAKMRSLIPEIWGEPEFLYFFNKFPGEIIEERLSSRIVGDRFGKDSNRIDGHNYKVSPLLS